MANADLNINVGVTPKNVFQDITTDLKNLDKTIDSISSQFKTLTAGFVAFTAIKGSFDFIIDATRQMEDLTTQFVRFTGSTQEARRHLQQLQNIPGPSLEEITNADKALLNFGVSASKTASQLKQLNDVAITTGAKIGDLSEIFGKIQEDGNLTAETFSKLSKQLPGFATDFASALGMSRAEFRELAREGKITSDQVLSALSKMTSEGGKFFEATEKNAGTLTGAFNSLSDSLKALSAQFGEGFTPTLTKVTNSIAGFINRIVDARSTLQTVVDDPALARIKKLNEEIEDLSDSLETARKNSKDPLRPWDWRKDDLKEADRILAKIEAIKRAREQIVAIAGKKVFEETTVKIQGEQDQNDQKEQDKRDEEARRKRKEALDQSVKDAEARGQKLLELDRNLNSLREQAAVVSAEKIRLINEQTANDQLRIKYDALSGEQQLELEKEQQLTRQKIDAITARENQINSQIAEFNAQRLEINGQSDEAERTREDAHQAELTAIMQKGEADRRAIAAAARADEFNLEKIEAQQRQKFEEATVQDKLKIISAGLSSIAALQSSGSREMFEIGKAAAVAQAAIAIPLSAMEAYKAVVGFGGPFAAAIAASAAIIAQTLQLNKILASKPPKFAEGGMVPGVGNKDSIPALLTPGEVVVPKQNFEDLAQNFALGAIANDQVQLMTQSNALQAKILEQITAGVIIDKMTLMIGLLEDIKRSAAFGAGGTGPMADIVIDPVPSAPTGRQQPERVIDYSRVRDQRA